MAAIPSPLVPEVEILDRLLEACKRFQAQVRSGAARLGEKKVEIVPPDPIGELGSGIDKIAAGHVEQVTVGGEGTGELRDEETSVAKRVLHSYFDIPCSTFDIPAPAETN